MINIPERFDINLQQCILDEAKKQNKTPGKLFADFYEVKKELARIDNYFQEKYFRKQVQELNN